MAVLLCSAVPALGQTRVYGGAASIGFVTQALEETPARLGGTSWSAGFVLGWQLSRRFSVEFEPTFGGEFAAREYTYLAAPALRVSVVGRGRESFYTAQIRGWFGILEPVAGFSWVHSTVARDAAFVDSGRLYLHDELSQDALAVATGLDVRLTVASRVDLIPTFRLFVVSRPDLYASSESRVTASPVVIRYGTGTRVTF